jgi:hypothetical protein
MQLHQLVLFEHDPDKDTTTENKKKLDIEIYSHVRVPNGQNIVMLVGPHAGLKRHLDHAVGMGLADLSKLWIVDNDRRIIDDLLSFYPTIADKYKGKPNFVLDDLFSFLQKWDNAKHGKIYFVDFDGTTGARQYHFDVYEECLRLGVRFLSLVGSARNKLTKDMKALNKEMRYRKVMRVGYVDKETQKAEHREYNDHYQRLQNLDRTAHDFMAHYLGHVAGQKSLLKAATYKGRGSDNEGTEGKGNPMFSYMYDMANHKDRK